jgi:glutamate dehydrogenase
MITSDPQQRAVRFARVQEVLSREATPEDRDLLGAFAGVVYPDLPDGVALGLPVEALADRLREHFRFVVREMPPASQLYRGLPGIHVVVRNPEGQPDATVVETHTQDAPFIVESLKNYFRKSGLRVLSAVHPILTVRRQWERIVSLGGASEEGSRESFCHLRIERLDSRERLRRIEHEIHSVLKAVLTAVEDFPEMLRAVKELAPRLRGRRGEPASEARAFLEWLVQENYVFQGVVRYRLGADGTPDRVHESATGVFTDPALLPVVFPGLLEEVESHLVPAPDDDRVVDIDFCNNASAIYHLEPIDDVVVREWGPDGNLTAATVLMGRLAMGAFAQRASDVPLLQGKLEGLLERCGVLAGSHAFREIRALFNRFPKRELFYAGLADLRQIVERIVYMAGDDEVAVHARTGVGYACLYLAFSRLRYSYKTEESLRAALADAFGPISFGTATDCGSVTLLICYFDSARLDRPIDAALARRITDGLVTTWEDRVALALEAAFGAREGLRLFDRYVRQETRSGLYREATPPEEVPEDLRHLDGLERRLEVRVIPRGSERATLKLYSLRPLPLTAILDTLQNLGLTATEELRMPLRLPEGRKALLFRFEVEAPPDRVAALLSGADRFADALRALDEERASDDALNGLILQAGLDWRQVEVLRTLRNHLLQVRTHYNAETVNGVLLRNSAVAGALYRAFAARFDPALTGDRAAALAAAEQGVGVALESVRSLAEDEVLRAIDNLIGAALRTNFFQRPERPVVAIKVDSRRVEAMPSPRPMFEIYVHSRLLEGIHLRGGKVARGGIRWSDRHDDFRTEVLGLMKTQMVKNAIIVPVGSKGGFVLKGNVPPRPALDAYLVERYREFVSGLLDVTDNRLGGAVVHPPEVVLHDGDDPYLVVAADKGTAHLSDTANSVSAQYGFWLGDAFASGGSAGYDHKKMGITARGAWECVKHHFRNLGHDIQTQPFTAVGVGDMSGDVFGNGALLSPVMRLMGAFDHRHIFIDPEPDPARSYRERERLFRLPRSSWKDYDASLISRGGGVFERSAKAIPLSPEMKRLLDLDAETASGEEVIRRLLSAGVDLLYNGGIGTYVKASSETDTEVGDRTNDRVRVDAREVRARVVGEGGNLGLTQKGRIEYWAQGGSINTDAVDNSGGVDTSDHEVNIKILLDMLAKQGVVKGREDRNRILGEMTDEVAALVLADNEDQARALSLDCRRSGAGYEQFVGFLEDMVAAGILNRADDAIPSREELLAAPERQRGLPRPLLCVVLGHTKMWGFEMLLESQFPESPAASPFLVGYFPGHLQQGFSRYFEEHTLRREIVATAAINHLVNHAGMTFLWRTLGATGAGIGDVMGAYLEAEERIAARELRGRILAPERPAQAQHEALLELEEILEASVRGRLAGAEADIAGRLAALRGHLGA